MGKSVREGTVLRQNLGHYFVSSDSKVVDCALSTLLRKQLEYPEADPASRRRRVAFIRSVRVVDPVAIGDRVRFEEGEGGRGLIRKVLPRRNKISRKASGTSRREQILAANVDQLIPVFSADDPPLDLDLLDRMLGISEWQSVAAAVCINKIDLTEKVRETMAVYEQIGYRVFYTSVVADRGKEAFHDLLKDRLSLLMGPSGSGKSSLLNWIQPGLRLRTAEISQATREGRHTTTHTELFEVAGNGFVGDLPGAREFSLWDVRKEDVSLLFKEFEPLLGQCRFGDCSHFNEPDCAIKEGVASGQIDRRRYASYLRVRSRL